MTTLTGPIRGPASGGAAKQLVVLLHGVGANGDDLFGLTPMLAQALPDAAFAAPNAPQDYDMAPVGYQWFSLADRRPAILLGGIQATRPLLNTFLDAQLEAHGLPPSALALIGFSQGTMMALYTAPRRAHAMAGVVGFSGALLGGENLAEESTSRPPIVLIHGENDPVVPPMALEHARMSLGRAGFDVAAYMRPALGHAIDPGGLQIATAFLRRVFDLDAA